MLFGVEIVEKSLDECITANLKTEELFNEGFSGIDPHIYMKTAQ